MGSRLLIHRVRILIVRQVNGYAKKIAGTVFRNEGEVQQGKEIMGETPSQAGVASTQVAPPKP